MIFRKPRIEDYRFIYECYQDWPLGEDGPITLERAIGWTRRWIHRTDQECRIAEEGERIGILVWREHDDSIQVENIVIHPDHRGKGFARAMWQKLFDEMTAKGVIEATFDAIPGAIAAKIEQGTFEKVSEGIGRSTGLPIVTGRVTPDMEV